MARAVEARVAAARVEAAGVPCLVVWVAARAAVAREAAVRVVVAAVRVGRRFAIDASVARFGRSSAHLPAAAARLRVAVVPRALRRRWRREGGS